MNILQFGKPRPPVPVSADEPPSPAPVRGSFRVLGGGLGASYLALPAYAVWQVVSALLQGEWGDLPKLAGLAGAFTLLIPIGLKMIRAARTGLDPFSEDRVIQDAESRAMLAAVERTGMQPGPARP